MINLDELTIVGQGSEWFWAMLQVILLAATILVIARQLSAQAAANAQTRIDTLFADWSTYEMQHRRLVLALHLRYEGVQGKAWPGSVTWEKAQPIVIYMTNVMYLLRKGHLSMDEIAVLSVPFRQWVAALEPFFAVAGTFTPVEYDALETLARRFEAWDGKVGRTKPLLPITVWLDDVIDRTTQNLRLEQERRSGVIPEPPAGVVAAQR